MDKAVKTVRKSKTGIGRRSAIGDARVSRGKMRSHSALKSFPHITRTPGVMGGKPCIKGSRMTVGMIVAQIGGGATIEELMDDFPELKRAEILEAIRYAGWLAGDMVLEIDPAA